MFEKGGPPGPGRPKGQRNALSTSLLAALNADFAEHGAGVIRHVRETEPTNYLRILASLCPRELRVEHNSQLADLSDAELLELEQHLALLRAKTVRAIERAAGNGELPEFNELPLETPASIDIPSK